MTLGAILLAVALAAVDWRVLAATYGLAAIGLAVWAER